MEPSSQFDNDFEKLTHDDIVSSSSVAHSHVEAAFVSHSPPDSTEAEPLINFGDGEPALQPQKTDASEPKKTAEKKTTCCMSLKNMDPRVADLLYWRDIKKTAAVFVSSLAILLSLALCSVVSVVAYTSLIVLTITVSFRLYKTVMGAVQKSTDEQPFKSFIDADLKLTEEDVHKYADVAVKHFTQIVADVRRLILIEDMVDSLKFGLFLWVLTYIGAWFNGITLIILADVGFFTLPKVYDVYKVQIDEYLDIACTKLKDTREKIQEKVPFLAKKKQA